MSLSMFKIGQIETNSNQIIHFKSQSDSQRYWKFFVENEDIILPHYVNPLLIAEKGYTQQQIQTLDFLNCILPIPLFSERFVEKNSDILKNEILFFPCKIKKEKDITEFFLGRILRSGDILDVQHSGSRRLMDGTQIPDIPFMYRIEAEDFYILRDKIYKSHYIISKKFASLCEGFNLELKSVVIYK